LKYFVEITVKVERESGSADLKFKVPMAPEAITDMNLIKEVCMENFHSSPAQLSKCILQLSTLEVVTDTSRQICKIHPFAKCEQFVEICQEARTICESVQGIRTAKCQECKHRCLNRIFNLQLVHKTLKQLDNSGSVTSVRMTASLQSHSGSKAVHTAIAFGVKKEHSNTYKIVSNVEVKTSESPVYEVKFVSRAELPRVNNRWNKEKLLEEALNLVLNGQVKYGYENSQMEKIEVKSELVKSQEQKESVRQSPEWKRCSEEEQKGNKLAHICEKSRHQAASVDEVKAELNFPRSVVSHPYFYKVGEFIKSYFLTQLWQEESSHTSQTNLKLIAKVYNLKKST
jgi:hypothetical protein